MTDATKTTIDRVKERFDPKPNRSIGATAYGSVAILGWLREVKQTKPDIRLRDVPGEGALLSEHAETYAQHL